MIQLRAVDPEKAVVAINKLFAGADEKVSSSAPKVEAETTLRRLLIRGTDAQVAQIRAMVSKMEGPDTDIANAGDRGNIRMVPLTGRQARVALDQLQQLWPATHQNKIHIVTPGGGYPEIRPGSGAAPAPNTGSGIIDERRSSPATPVPTPTAVPETSSSSNLTTPARTQPAANSKAAQQLERKDIAPQDHSSGQKPNPVQIDRSANIQKSHFLLAAYPSDSDSTADLAAAVKSPDADKQPEPSPYQCIDR